MELSALQLIILGAVASGIVQMAKLLAAKIGKDMSRIVTTIIMIVVSVGLGYFWLQPQLPPVTDPMKFAMVLLQVAAEVIGFATLIYNFLLGKVFEIVGWTKVRLLLARKT